MEYCSFTDDIWAYINMVTFQQTGKMMLRYILGAACDVCGFVGLQTLHSSAGLCVILYNTCIGK